MPAKEKRLTGWQSVWYAVLGKRKPPQIALWWLLSVVLRRPFHMCHAFFFAFDFRVNLLYRAAGIYNRAVIVEIAWAGLLFFTAFLS
ncbi:hypothetical protein, partial [Agathobaculum hominis]